MRGKVSSWQKAKSHPNLPSPTQAPSHPPQTPPQERRQRTGTGAGHFSGYSCPVSLEILPPHNSCDGFLLQLILAFQGSSSPPQWPETLFWALIRGCISVLNTAVSWVCLRSSISNKSRAGTLTSGHKPVYVERGWGSHQWIFTAPNPN